MSLTAVSISFLSDSNVYDQIYLSRDDNAKVDLSSTRMLAVQNTDTETNCCLYSREKGFQFESPPYQDFTQLKDPRKKKTVWQKVKVEI